MPQIRSIVAAVIVAARRVPRDGRRRGRRSPSRCLGGRVRLGGEVSGTIAPEDLGWFNYSDYEMSTLRLFRVDLAAEARLASFASVLFDVRSDNLDAPRVYALYLRLRPWAGRELDLQAGLVPPVFGAFPRRRYATDNPLPSLPARLPVPDGPARGRRPVTVGGARGPARPRVAGAVPGRLGRGRAGPARSSTPSGGTPACSCGSAASRSRSRWPSPRGRSATRG